MSQTSASVDLSLDLPLASRETAMHLDLCSKSRFRDRCSPAHPGVVSQPRGFCMMKVCSIDLETPVRQYGARRCSGGKSTLPIACSITTVDSLSSIHDRNAASYNL